MAWWVALAWAGTVALEADVADGYHRVDDLASTLEVVLAAHPEVAVETIGETLDHRPIVAYHVPATGEVHRKVLVFGGIHALEWISVEVALATLVDAIAHPRAHVAVTVVPLLNPDGRAKVEADLDAGENSYRRGNRRNVDLNRDFAVHREATSVWRKVLPGYHATTEAPLSQPESRALDALADRERYDRAASLHAFGGFFYHPWSGRWARPDDWEAFVRLGHAMEAAQGVLAYKTRQLSRWGFFFRAHGTEIDHLYGEYGTLAFLVELTRSGIDPGHPRDLRTYFRWYNPREPARHVRAGLAAMRALIDAELDPPTPTGRRSPG